MTISEPSRIAFGSMTAPTTAKSLSKADQAEKTSDIVAGFLKEVKKTPVQRLKETILKSHGLTEEQFAALSSEDQTAIMKEVQEALTGRAQTGKNASTTGQLANILV